MRSLGKYLKRYRRESILAPLFKLLEAMFDLLVPIVVARMIDSGVIAGQRSTVFLCGAVFRGEVQRRHGGRTASGAV